MGLLTDPSGGQGMLAKVLMKYHSKLAALMYIIGFVWFFLLAYTPLNNPTYISENALLPGLVKSEFKDDASAKQFYDQLLDEMKKYDDSIPYPWLLAKFRQIGLDVYTHNFTLNYPFGKTSKKYSGKNVYGILRAARAASTEALVMSVPYRPPSNIHPTTTPSIAIMLAFAKFANKEKYWSKDIIFLITEHEQLGIQAWLEAYHHVVCGQKNVLDHGELHGRGGAIQAAINLELHDVNLVKIDVKIEGLNGQLPNLDLFNLAARMCSKEGVPHVFKNRENKSYRHPTKDWAYSFTTLMSMVFSQATGVPTGNHGLFHRFGIQAITLEGYGTKDPHLYYFSFLSVGRILEGIFRSLNNLLERFHQSYFFYLLPSSERFISIGLYIPSVCLIAGALFVKACGKWFHVCPNPEAEEVEEYESDEEENKLTVKEYEERYGFHNDASFDLLQIGTVLFLTHSVGIIIMNSPKYLTKIGAEYGFNTELSIYGGLVILSLALLPSPIFLPMRSSFKNMILLNVLALLELGVTLICLSMCNFSLGILLGLLYVPFALLINPDFCRSCLRIKKILWIFVHPIIVITLVVFTYTFIAFTGEPFKENIVRGFAATQHAVVFSIVDSMIYSNWLYNLITCIILPNWLLFWYVLFFSPSSAITAVTEEKKNN